MTAAVDVSVRTFTPKQQLALSSSARFLLFGGGAGGGKTEWAIFDGLGLNNPGGGKRAIDFSEYTGLFLRRTLPQLRDVIKRTQAIYPIWGKGENGAEPVWREQQKVWIFPSGARIFFGYVDRPDDVYNYQGWEYQWICFEELTQWPSSSAFMYLHTRLRRLEGCPIEIGMRATCNPGGVGHHWVKSYWGINDAGDPTHFSVPVEIELDEEDGSKSTETIDLDRQFIPARLDENPHLSRAEYAAALEDPSQSAQMRRALRDGRWDVVDIQGRIYGEQVSLLHNSGHIREVPYDSRYPVNTFWDIGVSDACAIWFHQRIDGLDYFIRYFEGTNRGLREYWRDMQLFGYVYGAHFLPHDAGHRRHADGGVIQTIEDILRNLGMRNIEIVPRTHVLRQAIEATRAILPRCFFDAHGTERGIECLTNYRYKVNDDGSQSLRPIHDEFSHGADGFRQFAQAYEMIEDAIAYLGDEEYDPETDVPWSRRAVTAPPRKWIV